MTSENRLNRVERIARLLTRAGLRLRRDIHELEAKINVLVTTQINYEDELTKTRREHDEKIAQIAEKIAIMVDAQIRYEEQLAQTSKGLSDEMINLIKSQTRTDERLARLAKSQEQTDRRLVALFDLVRRQQNGDVMG